MSDHTGIEWTDATWNPIRGCSKVSAGCAHCYAESVAARFSGPGQPYAGLVDARGRWNGEVRAIPEHLEDPLRWRKARRIFVNSMSDLFHERVGVEVIAGVFAVMAAATHHTFQVLTKRPARMRVVLSDAGFWQLVGAELHRRIGGHVEPLRNVWLGVSIEDQRAADERIPLLLQTPAAVRFLSCEPLLGPVDLGPALLFLADTQSRLDWVIAGGESGHHARPMHPAWPSALRDQCTAAGVAFFFKQWGEWLPGHHYQYSEAASAADSDPTHSRFDCMDWDGERYQESGSCWSDEVGDDAVYRVGKQRAGRVLDGQTWDEFPVAAK